MQIDELTDTIIYLSKEAKDAPDYNTLMQEFRSLFDTLPPTKQEEIRDRLVSNGVSFT